MVTLSPKFLVFDSKSGPEREDGGVIYCSSQHANVQWPKSVRRGRPRKDLKENGQLLKDPPKEGDRPSKERYEFVDCSDGRQRNDSNTRRFVRTHAMHDYLRQKKIAAHAKSGLQDLEIESQHNDTEKIIELERSLNLSPERWSTDPFDSFPMKMQPHMHDLLHLYVSAFTDHFYPIEAYWGFNPSKKVWVPLALTDPALLHTILFCGDQFGAKLNGQKERPSAIKHLEQAIRIINERLQNPLQELSDSTVAAVAGVALTELASGNQANWRIHMAGIKRMVEIRGGLSAFERNPILHDKLCRADICGAVSGYSKLYLQVESRKVQPNALQGYDETEKILAPGFQAVHDECGVDSDLFGILYEVHAVTRDINIVDPPKSEIIPLKSRERIRSVQRYLLSREHCDDISGSGDQLFHACRLGVLLYLGIIQNDFLVSNEQLIWQLKTCLQWDSFATDFMRGLRLWLIFLAGSLIRDPTEKLWLVCAIVQSYSQLSLSNWCDAKLLLESFAWVGKVQDNSGQDLWDEAMRMQSVFRE